jgi:uncharacterized protein YfbU (UPF0304 family)
MFDNESEFSLDEDRLALIDKWRASRQLTRAQAVARLIDAGLQDPGDAQLSKGDKLILSTLCAISRKVGAEGMIDPDFLEAAIQGGHDWAIEWQHPSLLHGHTNSSVLADFVVLVLSMWKRIEESFDHLPDHGKEEVRRKAGLSDAPRFPGWSSYDEANCKSTARFMTDRMELFPMFEGRSAVDSGSPVVKHYKAMLKCLDGFGPEASERRLNADELVRLLASA